MRSLLSVVVLAMLLCSGCSIVVDRDSSAASSASPSADPSDDDAPLAVPEEDPPPCALIRAGIDAFNVGEPEATVRRFKEALPLAEKYAADEPGHVSRLLLEAVKYYVALPPEDYQRALTSSPEFKRHQLVTLGVCRYDGGPAPSQSPSEDAQTT